MGKITGNYESEQHKIASLVLGDNDFRTETLSVAAAGEGETINIVDGTVLTRDSDTGKLVVAEDETSPLFVLVDEVITPITEAGDYAVRVCVSGRVDRRKVFLDGTAVSDAQVDALRANGILAEDAYSVN